MCSIKDHRSVHLYYRYLMIFLNPICFLNYGVKIDAQGILCFTYVNYEIDSVPYSNLSVLMM